MADPTQALQQALAFAQQADADLTSAKANEVSTAAAAKAAVDARVKADVQQVAAHAALDAMKAAAFVSGAKASAIHQWLLYGGGGLALGLAVMAAAHYGHLIK